jgi:hypothetical protein
MTVISISKTWCHKNYLQNMSATARASITETGPGLKTSALAACFTVDPRVGRT